jgi:hypothetical protein
VVHRRWLRFAEWCAGIDGLRESGEATNLAAETARKRKKCGNEKRKTKNKTKKEKRNSTLKTNCGNDAETNLASPDDLL